MHVCIYVCTYVRMYVCIYVHVLVHVNVIYTMYTYTCACMYSHIVVHVCDSLYVYFVIVKVCCTYMAYIAAVYADRFSDSAITHVIMLSSNAKSLLYNINITSGICPVNTLPAVMAMNMITCLRCCGVLSLVVSFI